MQPKNSNRKDNFSNISLFSAQIGFLLLSMVVLMSKNTCQIEKGIAEILPSVGGCGAFYTKERNYLNIHLDHKGHIFVYWDQEWQSIKTQQIKEIVKLFVNNYGKNPDWSVDPTEATISLSYSKRSNYQSYVTLKNQINKAYNELRAEYLGINLEQYLVHYNQEDSLHNRAGEKYPCRVLEKTPPP